MLQSFCSPHHSTWFLTHTACILYRWQITQQKFRHWAFLTFQLPENKIRQICQWISVLATTVHKLIYYHAACPITIICPSLLLFSSCRIRALCLQGCIHHIVHTGPAAMTHRLQHAHHNAMQLAVFSAANELLVLKRSIHENLVKEKRVRSDVSAL